MASEFLDLLALGPMLLGNKIDHLLVWTNIYIIGQLVQNGLFFCCRVLPLWVGARGVEFDWRYIQMSFDSNVSLVRFHHTCYCCVETFDSIVITMFKVSLLW